MTTGKLYFIERALSKRVKKTAPQGAAALDPKSSEEVFEIRSKLYGRGLFERQGTSDQRKSEAIAKGIELPAKRGPGRPKGTKNKKTLEREARIAAAKARAEKRRRRKEASSISDPKPPEGTSIPTTG